MLMIEEILDRVARRLDLPPDVVRERNFYRDGRHHALRAAGEGRRAHRAHLVRAQGQRATSERASLRSRSSTRRIRT